MGICSSAGKPEKEFSPVIETGSNRSSPQIKQKKKAEREGAAEVPVGVGTMPGRGATGTVPYGTHSPYIHIHILLLLILLLLLLPLLLLVLLLLLLLTHIHAYIQALGR